MDFITQSSNLITFFSGLGVVFAGGVGAFFIIRSQIAKVLKDELDIYKEKVSRLEDEVRALKDSIELIKNENLALVSERDYLKALIISALTTKDTVHKNVLEEALKKINKKGIVSKAG